MLSYEIIKRDKFYLECGCHPKDSIIILLSGKYECKISGNNYIAKENDIFVFNKNSTFERNVITPIECIYLQFDVFPISLSDGLIGVYDTKRLKSTVEYLKNSIKKENDYLIRHFTEDIFILINHHTPGHIIYEFINYFNVNFDKKINLDMLAKKFHMSKQFIIRQFKKEMNSTPIEYLNTVRIQNGKSMLVNSDLTVSEIAAKCGYENVHYFSISFKKRTSISPAQYREKYKL